MPHHKKCFFVLVCGLVLTASLAFASDREVVKLGTQGAGPYSPGIIADADKLVFTSGQLGLNASGKLQEGIEAQAKQALDNVKAVLEAAGSGMDKVVKVTIYMTDINDYGTVNGIYKTYFSKDFPARTALQVANLPLGGLIEIEAIAVK